MSLKIPCNVVIVECKSIDLSEKDYIEVDSFKSLLYLLGGGSTLFKRKNYYYLMGDSVVYYWIKT